MTVTHQPRRLDDHGLLLRGPGHRLRRRRRPRDTARFGRFFHEMLERGVYLPPAQFEAAFVSLAHSEADIDATVAAAAEAFRAVA